MRASISIPDTVFEQADAVAQWLSLSRSELYTRAINEFLERHRHNAVTQKLDEVYHGEDSSLDPVLLAMQAKALS